MDEFDDLLREWKRLGHDAAEFWGSELWEVARTMGIRGGGETDDPVIRGARMISLKSDDDDSGASSVDDRMTSNLAERIAAGEAREAQRRAEEEASE